MGQVDIEPVGLVGSEPEELVGSEPVGLVGIAPEELVGSEPVGLVGIAPVGLVGSEPEGLVGIAPEGLVGIAPVERAGRLERVLAGIVAAGPGPEHHAGSAASSLVERQLADSSARHVELEREWGSRWVRRQSKPSATTSSIHDDGGEHYLGASIGCSTDGTHQPTRQRRGQEPPRISFLNKAFLN